jgi:hypothetical protein
LYGTGDDARNSNGLLYVALICLIILTSKTFQMAWPSEAFTLDESGIMQTLPPTVFDSLHEKGVE